MKWKDKTYILTPNKDSVFPSEIVYFDTETYFNPSLKEQTHTLRLGVAIRQCYSHGSPRWNPEYHYFTTPLQFWTWLESRLHPKVTVWVIAHNMDFDFAAVEGFKFVEERNWKVKFWAIGSYAFLLRLHKETKSLQFVDSLGFMRTSLLAIGERVGLKKLPLPDPSESDNVWRNYCTRDVEVLKVGMESYIKFVSDHNLGSLALTGPGQAMTAFRHRFMSEKIIIHRYEDVMEFERVSYHGGRTEAFHVGTVPASPIYYLDVTSMYGSVMKQGTFPCQLLGEFDNPTLSDMRKLLSRYELLVDCHLDTDLPVVPVYGDKLVFPVGSFRVTLAGPEFKYCWDAGYVKKVYHVVVYRRGRPFVDYVDYFWDIRAKAMKQEDATMKWFAKLLQNSFYGKWGQHNPVYDEQKATPGELPGISIVTSTENRHRSSRLVFGGKVWEKVGEAPARFTSVCLASWVTSYARVRLWELAQRASLDHVYYCDTDSLFVDQTGYEHLRGEIKPDTLGALSLRKKGILLTINGPKDYVFDDEVALKGVPKSASMIREGVYSYMTFDRFRTRLRKGTPDMLNQREVIKTLTRVYDKGEVTSSGKVRPFRMSTHP